MVEFLGLIPISSATGTGSAASSNLASYANEAAALAGGAENAVILSAPAPGIYLLNSAGTGYDLITSDTSSLDFDQYQGKLDASVETTHPAGDAGYWWEISGDGTLDGVPYVTGENIHITVDGTPVGTPANFIKSDDMSGGTTNTVPATISDLVIDSAANGVITVSHSAPNDGGSPITDYILSLIHI